MSVTVRPAAVADASWMAGLSRTSFAPRLHDYLVSAQSGIDRFWEVVLAYPASFPDRCFLIAEGDGGRRLGFADFTLAAPGLGHLSYVCVVESARGQGVARELLRTYVVRHSAVRAMQLDVFDDNVPARALYDRLGFGIDAATSWWVADLTPPTSTPDVVFEELHTTSARWTTYGFCELSGVVGDRRFRLGLVGRSVLRCFDAADLGDPDVLHAVQATFPGIDRVFVITPGDEPPTSAIGDLRRVNRSLRMSTPAIPQDWSIGE